MAGDYSSGQLLLGDPDEFAQEMIRLINDKEFRWVKQNETWHHVNSEDTFICTSVVDKKLCHIFCNAFSQAANILSNIGLSN